MYNFLQQRQCSNFDAVTVRVGEPPAHETELLLFRRWFPTVHARQEELSEDTFTESAPPMQSKLIWAIKEVITH
jgi:hypothetical protein